MARPRSNEARQRALDSAARVLLNEGVTGLTVDAVAEASGVAKTTIYRHFGSRSALIAAALDDAIPVPEVPDTGVLRDDLHDFLTNVMPIFGNERLRDLMLEASLAGRRDPELAQLIEQNLGRRWLALHSLVSRWVERGELRADLDPVSAFEVLEGPLLMRSIMGQQALEAVDLNVLVDRFLLLFADRSGKRTS